MAFIVKFKTTDGKELSVASDEFESISEVIDRTIIALEDKPAWLIAGGIVIKKQSICSFRVDQV